MRTPDLILIICFISRKQFVSLDNAKNKRQLNSSPTPTLLQKSHIKEKLLYI